MNWEVEEKAAYVVLKPLETRLDSAIAPRFRTDVTELTERTRKALVLDLANVEFMDSSGLGAVVGCYKLIQSVGEMHVCNVGPQVKDIFRLTHMDRIFDVNDSFDDCVEKLAA
jgi:anti-sigma B factor antagonist